MLTTEKNINHLFSMDTCFVKASKSYENLSTLPLGGLWIPPRW